MKLQQERGSRSLCDAFPVNYVKLQKYRKLVWNITRNFLPQSSLRPFFISLPQSSFVNILAVIITATKRLNPIARNHAIHDE